MAGARHPDDGAIIGLEPEYRTLKEQDRDGFEQALITTVADHLGGDLCPHLQVVFHAVQGKHVCRVIIAPSPRAVFLQQSGVTRLYLRSAATTRELNIKEAMDYQANRWSGSSRSCRSERPHAEPFRPHPRHRTAAERLHRATRADSTVSRAFVQARRRHGNPGRLPQPPSQCC